MRTRSLAALQGVAGVGCVAGGAYLVFGAGWALMAAGGFLIFGAWSSSR